MEPRISKRLQASWGGGVACVASLGIMDVLGPSNFWFWMKWSKMPFWHDVPHTKSDALASLRLGLSPYSKMELSKPHADSPHFKRCCTTCHDSRNPGRYASCDGS